MRFPYLITLFVSGLVAGDTNEQFRLAMVVNVMDRLVDDSFKTVKRFERLAGDGTERLGIFAAGSTREILGYVLELTGTLKNSRKTVFGFSQIDASALELAFQLGSMFPFIEAFVKSFWMLSGLPVSGCPRLEAQRVSWDLLLQDWRNLRKETFELQLDIMDDAGRAVSAFERDAILVMESASDMVGHLSSQVHLLHDIRTFPDSVLIAIDLSVISLSGLRQLLAKSLLVLKGPDHAFTEKVCKANILMEAVTLTVNRFVPLLPEGDTVVALTKAMIVRLLAEWPSQVKAFADLISRYSINCEGIDVL